jgi:3-hydroxy-3-methylglutaryl CoA synthase
MSSGNDMRRSDGRIGINEIIVTVPGLAVKAEEVVRAFHSRNGNTESENSEAITKDVGKMKEGLGIKQIRLPGYSESNVTFVADAIYTFIMKVTSSDRDTERIRGDPVRNIYYASESNPDRSRPEAEASLLLVYSKLLGMDADGYRWIVDMFKEATMIPVTYACAGGGISLADAAAHVRASCHYGSPESALIITADTSIYDNSRAPNAEFTQGAGATLVWLTRDPEIATILYDNRYGGFHMPLSDFTKFGHETPIVHGKFSERVYVYTVAKALEKLEGSGEFPLRDMGFFVTHVPFPKQSIYFASFLFAHYLKNYRKELFDEIQARPDVGREPIGDNGRITNLMDRKFREFNSEEARREHNTIHRG